MHVDAPTPTITRLRWTASLALVISLVVAIGGLSQARGEPADAGAKAQPAGSFLIPAWAFDRGNARTFTNQWADAEPMVGNGQAMNIRVDITYWGIDAFQVPVNVQFSTTLTVDDFNPCSEDILPGDEAGT